MQLWSLCVLLLFATTKAVKVIQNGLAAPEIVHTPILVKPRCTVHAPPLDLVFVLDSSGSLRNKFQDEIDVIRRIVRHVTIGKEATRVMLVQFSGIQHLEFDFLRYTSRDELLAALDVLRHVSGITRIGGAFEFTRAAMTPGNGMRGPSVPKILYLLSDGRTHDFPKDNEEVKIIREAIPNFKIWAYGTGEYVATPALINYTLTEDKIVTNKNLETLESQFDAFKGTEVCEKIPVCIRGSDKPLDLALVIDASESLDRLFDQQIQFAIERIVQNVNVHPEATRLTLITYSGITFTHYTFNSIKFSNNSAVIRHLNTLRSIKGTTSTHVALQEALDLFTTRAAESGARENVTRLIIVLTDGHSQRPPGDLAAEIRAAGIPIIAISVTPRPYVDETELLSMAGDPARTFTPTNLQEFELEFFKFVGFGCLGMDIDQNAKPQIRGATDVACDDNSVVFTVRTQRPMQGVMYAQHHETDEQCRIDTDGTSREISIRFREDTCGLTKTASIVCIHGKLWADQKLGNGYSYNITVILQFHPIIMTRADQGLDISCFHAQPVPLSDVGSASIRPIEETLCTYRLHRFGTSQCVALDAKVGETLHHKWECDSPPNFRYLVHDCYARSERHNVKFIDSNGCEMDEMFLETPKYERFTKKNLKGTPFVYQEMSAFKFPGDGNIIFECLISLCDMSTDAVCTKMIPPTCEKVDNMLISDSNVVRRTKRETALPKASGFVLTKSVETRTLNVVEAESMRQNSPIHYCDIH